jgi:hypothetical protein
MVQGKSALFCVTGISDNSLLPGQGTPCHFFCSLACFSYASASFWPYPLFVSSFPL